MVCEELLKPRDENPGCVVAISTFDRKERISPVLCQVNVRLLAHSFEVLQSDFVNVLVRDLPSDA